MTRAITDEHIARVAIQLISARKGKLAAKAKRRELMSVEGGFCENYHGHRGENDGPENCYQAMLDGQLNDPTQFCEPCIEVHNACCEYKDATKRATGKLRTLTNLVYRRFPEWKI